MNESNEKYFKVLKRTSFSCKGKKFIEFSHKGEDCGTNPYQSSSGFWPRSKANKVK